MSDEKMRDEARKNHEALGGLQVELLTLRDALRDMRTCSGACECSGCVHVYERAIDITKPSLRLLAEHDCAVRAEARTAALEEAATMLENEGWDTEREVPELVRALAAQKGAGK